jgi:hypothetical protein
MNAQYTLGYSKGNTGGSNEAVTAGNNARATSDFDYDNGYNNFDVRHTLNLSVLYDLPGRGPFLSGWSVAGIVNARGNVLGMMPHPENHVEAALGSTDGRGLFAGLTDHFKQAA